MRTRRYLAPPEAAVAYYHCMSRAVNREWLFQPEDHEKFLEVFRSQAAFSGIRILTYCLLNNHFHILVEVPRRPVARLTEEELFQRLGAIYSRFQVADLRRQWTKLPEDQRPEWEERYLIRMWSLSAFMKESKQRFTQWFNRKRRMDGSRWKSRFTSVLVGIDGHALATMAAYIDLNPVRAGIVEDPKDYRWSGYGEAMGGNREAREAYDRVMEMAEGNRRRDAFEAYRMWLYQSGEQRGVEGPSGTEPVRKGISPERVKEIVARKGKLSLGEFLMCRMRHMSEGAIFGTKAFVDQMLARHREEHGSQRITGGRRLRYLESGEYYTLKDIRRTPMEMELAKASQPSPA